jgi:hypothetical protein
MAAETAAAAVVNFIVTGCEILNSNEGWGKMSEELGGWG